MHVLEAPSPPKRSISVTSPFSLTQGPPFGRLDYQEGLAAIEGLGISCRRVGLHPAEPEDPRKVSSSNHCFWLCDLKLSMMIWILREQAGFQRTTKEVQAHQVVVVFRNLVFPDQVVPEGVPGQVRDQAVVLVPVIAVVGENQIGV